MAVVVAQLAEQLFLTPEVPSSDPVAYDEHVINDNCWKDKNNRKKARNGPLKKHKNEFTLLNEAKDPSTTSKLVSNFPLSGVNKTSRKVRK